MSKTKTMIGYLMFFIWGIVACLAVASDWDIPAIFMGISVIWVTIAWGLLWNIKVEKDNKE